jgi:glutathione S-transferase
MNGLVFHHAPGCALSQAVRIILAEKGQEITWSRVDVTAFEQLDPAFMALTPAGQVPMLETRGAALTEAFLILCYLDERFLDPPLGGEDPAARYRVQVVGQLVERAIAPNLALLEWSERGGATPSADALMRLPLERRALWEKAFAGFSTAELTGADVGLARALDDCESWLAAHPYLAGEDYTIADILLFPFATRLDPAMLGPALSKWHQRVAAREAVAVIAEENPVVTMGPERGRWG